jgi:hypothetical protein
MTRKHNFDYSVGIPLAVGDRYYAQDLARDFDYLLDRLGLQIQDLTGLTSLIASGGIVSQVNGQDQINISAGAGYINFSVTVEDSWATTPPSTVSEDINSIRVNWPAISAQSIILTATLNGSAINYIKISFQWASGSTRARAKKAGTYTYNQTPSYFLTVDTVAPTAYQICLGTLTGAGSGATWTILNNSRTATPLSLLAVLKSWYMNGQGQISQRGTSWADAALPINTKNYLWDRHIQYCTSKGGTTLAASQGTLSPGTADELTLMNSGMKYYMRMTPAGAGSGFAVTDYCKISEYIENGTTKLCGGGNITVTFYARASVAGKKLGVAAEQYYGTGGSPTANDTLKGNILILSTTFTQYSVTIPTLSLSGKTLGTNGDDALIIEFFQMFGSTVCGNYFIAPSAAETFGGNGAIDITGISVTQGAVAQAYKSVAYGEELDQCRRYGIPLYSAIGFKQRMSDYSSNVLEFNIVQSNRFRIAPYLSTAGTEVTDWLVYNVNSLSSITGFTISVSGLPSVLAAYKVSHGLTDAVFVCVTNVPFMSAEY